MSEFNKKNILYGILVFFGLILLILPFYLYNKTYHIELTNILIRFIIHVTVFFAAIVTGTLAIKVAGKIAATKFGAGVMAPLFVVASGLAVIGYSVLGDQERVTAEETVTLNETTPATRQDSLAASSMENKEEPTVESLAKNSEVVKEESGSITAASKNTVVTPEEKKPENKPVTPAEDTQPTITDPIAEPKIGNVGIVIKVNARKGFFYIAYIEKNSAAAKQGLKIGQLIKSIEGRVLVNETTEEVNEWLTGPMGTNLSLTFSTGAAVSLSRGSYNLPTIDKVPKTQWDDELTSSEY